MKKILLIILVTMGLRYIVAQVEDAHQWKVKLKFIDESGKPIIGAQASVNYLTNRFIGLTDSNGIFEVSHIDHSVQLAFQGHKHGYYSFSEQYLLGFHYDQPKWNPTVFVLLKKIINPIPMYARKVNVEPKEFKKTGRPPIALNKTIGYDLMAGDWIAPYGKGQIADLVVTEVFSKQSNADMDFKLTISFSNAGDGIQEFTVPESEKYSGLRSPHEAPADGYQSELVRENYAHPGQTPKADYDPNRNYFIRVRTVLDANGNVKSALYGKIYGDPEQMNFRYYLNPTPNDRNIEFDPKQNLLGGLKSFDRVTEP